jgi:hypothetical protein
VPRPTKYTQAVADQIVQLLEGGISKADAAIAAGISPATFYDWQSKRPAFADRIMRAIEVVKRKLVTVVHGAAFEGDIRAATWLLERRYADEFGRAVKLSGAAEAPINVQVQMEAEMAELARRLAGMSDDELRAIVRAGDLNLGDKGGG